MGNKIVSRSGSNTKRYAKFADEVIAPLAEKIARVTQDWLVSIHATPEEAAAAVYMIMSDLDLQLCSIHLDIGDEYRKRVSDAPNVVQTDTEIRKVELEVMGKWCVGEYDPNDGTVELEIDGELTEKHRIDAFCAGNPQAYMTWHLYALATDPHSSYNERQQEYIHMRKPQYSVGALLKQDDVMRVIVGYDIILEDGEYWWIYQFREQQESSEENE